MSWRCFLRYGYLDLTGVYDDNFRNLRAICQHHGFYFIHSVSDKPNVAAAQGRRWPKNLSCTVSSPVACSSFSQEVKNSPPISKQTSQRANRYFFILKTVIMVYFRLLWHNSQIIH